MMNEGLALLILLGSLGGAVGAAWLGRTWLQTYMITILLLIGITDAKVIMVLGLPITLGTILYSAIFFCTDILTERYGKQAAFQAVRLSFAAIILFQTLLQLTRLAEPAADAEALSAAMDTVFGSSLRIVAVGLLVYLISQHLDIWLYEKIHNRTGDRHLWLRNNGSTVVSQFVDTYLFCFLAFFGVIEEWYIMATVGYGVKLVVAFSDTAFIYFARMLRPLDQPP